MTLKPVALDLLLTLHSKDVDIPPSQTACRTILILYVSGSILPRIISPYVDVSHLTSLSGLVSWRGCIISDRAILPYTYWSGLIKAVYYVDVRNYSNVGRLRLGVYSTLTALAGW